MRWEEYIKKAEKQPKRLEAGAKETCVNGHSLKEFGSPRWRWDAFHTRYYQSGVFCRQCCINRSKKYRKKER